MSAAKSMPSIFGEIERQADRIDQGFFADVFRFSAGIGYEDIRRIVAVELFSKANWKIRDGSIIRIWLSRRLFGTAMADLQRVVVDKYPSHEIDLLCENGLDLGGDPVALRNRDIGVHAHRDVED